MDEKTDIGPRLRIPKGTVIAGRFEVLGCLGTGGMGVVYKVSDKQLNDEVIALKILHPHLAENEVVFNRFRNEVLVARSLSHPHVVRTYDIGHDKQSYSYISMEYVDGESLRDFLISKLDSDNTLADGAVGISAVLPFERVANIFLQILSGVGYAHQKGIIHRDLKPSNVMLTSEGEVKLADFGTARIMGMDSGMTSTGQMVGTPDYMAPEQFRGEQLDQCCDIYALGIIAFELVMGCKPFPADTPIAVAYRHLNDELPEIDSTLIDVPEWFKNLICKATAKDKADRFSSVVEMAALVREHLPELVGLHSGMKIDPLASVETERKIIEPEEASSSAGWTLHYQEEASAKGEGSASVEEDNGRNGSMLGLGGGAIWAVALLAVVCLSLGYAKSDLIFEKGESLLSTVIESSVREEKAVVSQSSQESQREALKLELQNTLAQQANVLEEDLRSFQMGLLVMIDSSIIVGADVERELLPQKPSIGLFSASLQLKKGKHALRTESLPISKLRDVTWVVDSKDFAGSGKELKKTLQANLRLNITYADTSSPVLQLKPSKIVLPRNKADSLKVTGNLSLLKKAKPKKGMHRVDLVFSDTVLASQSLDLSIAKVSYSYGRQNGVRPGRYGAGGKVAILRGAAYVDESKKVRPVKKVKSVKKLRPPDVTSPATSPVAPRLENLLTPSSSGLPPARTER